MAHLCTELQSKLLHKTAGQRIRIYYTAECGLAFLQTLQGLSSKTKILDIHRRYLRVQQKDVQSDEEAETLWRQYLEFIVVKTHHRDTSGVGTRFSATPEVDALWHTHLLNT